MSSSSKEQLGVTQQFRSFRRWPLWLGLISFLTLTLGLAFGVLAALQGGWQLFVSAGAALTLSVTSGVAAYVSRRGDRIDTAAWLFIDGLLIFLPAISATIEGLGFILGSLGLLLVPSVAESAFREKERRRAVYIGVAASAAAVLVDLFSTSGRMPNPLPAAILTGATIAIVALVMLVIGSQFSNYRIQTKMVLAFLAVSLVPLGLFTFLNTRITRSALRDEATNKLVGGASQLASQIDTFVQLNRQSVATTAQMSAFQSYLAVDPAERAGSQAEMMARNGLQVHSRLDEQFVRSYGLLSPEGMNLLDSNPDLEGADESDRDYFRAVIETGEPFASALQIDPLGEPALYFSAPVNSPQGELVGVLRAEWHGTVLQEMVDRSEGLAGPESYAVLFDQNLIHLAHSGHPGQMLTALTELDPQVRAALQADYRLPIMPMDEMVTHLHNPELALKLESSQSGASFEVSDPNEPERISQAAVVETEANGWKVVFIQPQDVLFVPAIAQERTAILAAVLLAVTATGLAVIVAGFVSRPINVLTSAATRLAQGDLNVEAPFDSQDEFGLLARTFNTMAMRIQGLVTNLEYRVSERTDSLERRARQLQAAAEVSKSAATIREVNMLLEEAVQRISDRFGYYHAGVFLISDNGEHAELRAASSEGGQRMLDRGHRLEVGKVGIVGYVTGTGKWRMAADVREDKTHYANPDLPKTRSELVLPLAVGDLIIGALDVQSDQPNAFDEQDIIALQTMADQLAISIQNARLLSEQTALAAQRRKAIEVYRQLSAQLSYDQILADVTRVLRSTFGYERATLALAEGNDLVVRGASASSQDRLPRLGSAIPIGQGVLGLAAAQQAPLVTQQQQPDEQPQLDPILGELGPTLAIPLISRGQTLGAIALENPAGVSFGDEEVSLAELLASQVSIAIENARLFEETQHSLRQVDALYRRQTAEAWEVLVNARRTQGRENLAEFTMESASPDAYEGEEPIGAEIALRGEVIGRMDLHPSQPDGLTEEDREILAEVTGEVAAHLEQLRLVEEIQRRATQLETAAEIARVATGLLDLDALLERAVTLIRESFGFYHVSLYLIDERNETGRLEEASGAGDRELKRSPPQFDLRSRTVMGFAARTGEYYVAHDTSTDPYYVPHQALPDSLSELGVPLRIGERVIGVLDVHDSARYAFSEDDITALETLADQLAVAIENARLFRDALARATREQAVLDITGKIRASSDIDTMMRTAVQEIRAALGARRGTIRLAPSPGEPGSDGKHEAQPSEEGHQGNGREEPE